MGGPPRSAEIEAKLKEKGLKSRIHRKGYRNKPLSEREKRGNTTRSKVRARVEHVFGAQSNDMGGTLVRSIGMVRARARIANLDAGTAPMSALHGKENPSNLAGRPHGTSGFTPAASFFEVP